MKFFVVAALAVMAAVSAQEEAAEVPALDIDTIAKDPASLQTFVDCLNDKAECEAPAEEFKMALATSVTEACANCSDAYKHNLKSLLEGLKKDIPAEYDAIKAKFDPEGTAFAPLEEAIASS